MSPVPPRAIVSMLTAFAAALTWAMGAAASPRPTLTSITLDGDFADWAGVLANEANTTLDGPGFGVDCTLTDDRDCPIENPGYDLRRFAWTWDQDALHFYFERESLHTNGIVYLLLLFDANRNGLLEDGEPVLLLELRVTGPTFTPSARLQTYKPGLAAGDPIADPTGLVDGFSVGGAVGATQATLAVPGWDAGELLIEASLPWSDLGLVAGNPLDFALATAYSVSLAPQLDHLGAADGGPGTIGDFAASAGPDAERIAAPLAAVTQFQTIGKFGQSTAFIRLDVQAAPPTTLTFGIDLDRDGLVDLPLGTDAEGDGRFDGPLDSLEPDGDWDADGRLDLGTLAGGELQDLVITTAAPDGALVETLRVDLQVDAADGRSRDAAVILIRTGELGLVPKSVATDAMAGQVAWLAHRVDNTLGAPRVLDLDCQSALAWTCDLFEDPDGDGQPADALALADSDGSGRDDLSLPASGSRWILARVEAPAGAPMGLVDRVLIRLFENASVTAFASDEVTVVPPLRLTPHYLTELGEARHGPAGGSLWFAHELRSGLPDPVAVELVLDSPEGWPLSAHLDPDQDGRPNDALPLPGGLLTMPPAGVPLGLLLRVDLPPGLGDDSASRVRVEARLESQPSQADQVFDDAVVSLVSVWEDSTLTTPLTSSLPCQSLTGLGSGLPPNSAGTHRLTWRDPGGIVRSAQELLTDAQGQASRAFTPPAGDGLGDWTLSLEEAPAWLTIDRADLRLEDPLTVGTLRSTPATLDLGDAAATLQLDLGNSSFAHALPDLQLRWLVLDPSRSLYLAADGSFQPYSGVEAGTLSDLAGLARAEQRLVSQQVSASGFPVEGEYPVLLSKVWPCGFESTPSEIGRLRVLDDADHDGLSLDTELTGGSDPNDADSDDDGLIDSLDGYADSDGDGLAAALDCDADGDGLPDGLEVGLTQPHPDTDLAVGCFIADADSATLTDPSNPDTDAGGVPDGAEDRNLNGRFDAGEGDPSDPIDDAGLCEPAPPGLITGLRLRHDGDGLHFTWDALAFLDACTSYELLSGAPGAVPDAAAATSPSAAALTMPMPPGSAWFLVRADSLVGGAGGTGR